MSPRLRLAIPVLLVVGVVLAGALLGGGLLDPRGVPPGSSAGANGSHPVDPTIAPTPTPRPPVGGTELYGYVPYWEMTDANATHLRSVPLTTVALFSVTARRDGSINTRPTGYDRITGTIGRRLIDEAHARDARVEIVFSSFGTDRNGVFFGRLAAIPRPVPSPSGPLSSTFPSPTATPLTPSAGTPGPPPWHRTVDELVDLVTDLDVDGINVDVERLDDLDRAAYGEFLSTLRSRLREARPKARVSVATEGGLSGVANAGAAARAGVDRVFLMGYDYHWSGSQPGGSSPVERLDGLYDLRWSIDRYVEAGVPRDRMLLGLPLYGMSWRTLEPDRTAPVLSDGEAWILRRHLDVLLDPSFTPSRDSIEVAEYFFAPDGDAWRITYYDSAATLRPKLALARDHGLAGGGFWAIGYERGVPGFLDLMADFRDGKVHRSEAPAQ
jgi:hypothetical protein